MQTEEEIKDLVRQKVTKHSMVTIKMLTSVWVAVFLPNLPE